MSILRSLWRSPVFVVAAVLTLGLGIGVNVACFGVVRAVLMKPLGYREPDRLVLISGGATPIHYREIRSAAHQFSSIGAYAMEEDLAFTGGGGPELLKTNRVSTDFLEILGVSPLLGRSLSSAGDTALISYEFWQRQFHGDLQVTGQVLDLGGTAYSISGVLPASFAFPAAGIDVWLANPEDSPRYPPASRALSPFLGIFGRLRPGVTLQQASAELVVLQSQYAKNHPAMLDAKPKTPPGAKPLKQVMVVKVEPALHLLLGAVALVLLIACTNLATLLLARSATRATEFAVRAALGASRTRIAGRLICETLILYSLGGGIGALLAFLALSALRTISDSELPRASEIGFDGVVLAYAVGLSLLLGFLFGLAPALIASRTDLMFVIRGNLAGITRTRLRSVLIGGQIALSFVLLVGTTLLIETILRLKAEPLGFNPDNVVTARVAFRTNDDTARFYDDLLQRLSGVPGIEHVSASLTLPMMSFPGTPVQRADQPRLLLNQRPIAGIFIVTPDYFTVLQIPLRRGRTFTEHDREGTQRVAVIDENLARLLWPSYPAGPNPLGQRMLIGGVIKEPAEIVGIVGNSHQDLEGLGWNRGVYVPFGHSMPSAMLALRVRGNPMSYANAIRSSVRSVDASQPVSDLQSMQQLIDAELGSRRTLMRVLAFFSAVTVTLIVVGIYGLTSYSVAQRVREMGVRRALGARSSDLMTLIIRQVLIIALSGIAVGAAGAFGTTRFLKSYLFHTSAMDPIALLAVSGVFAVVTLTAALRPAFRAAKVDPAIALRYE
jgi:putative ABC transport system permease protein